MSIRIFLQEIITEILRKTRTIYLKLHVVKTNITNKNNNYIINDINNKNNKNVIFANSVNIINVDNYVNFIIKINKLSKMIINVDLKIESPA